MGLIQTDLKLQLLSKLPIYVDSIPIHSIALNQIAQIGYLKYQHMLKLLCLNQQQVSKFTAEMPEAFHNMSVFEFVVISAIEDKIFMNYITELLTLLCKSDVTFASDKYVFRVGDHDINNSNFDDFQSVVKFRNSINNLQDDIENPANEKTRQLLKKRKQMRARVQELRDDNLSDISIDDLVSILASGVNLPLDIVMGYDLYQFNNQFNRLFIMNEYDVNIQALLHGAKNDDIKLKHWIRKID